MLLFMDGAGHYAATTVPATAAAALSLKYTAVNPLNADFTITAEGRFGNCIKMTALNGSSNGTLVIAPFTTRLGTWPTANRVGGVFGCAIKVDDLGKSTMNGALFQVLESGTPHLRVYLTGTGTFVLVRTGATEGATGYPIMATSIEGLNSNTWQYLEFKWVIHPTAGMFEIRVGGVTVLTYSGGTVETDFVATTGIWNAVAFLGIATAGPPPYLTIRICDLYLADLVSVDADDVSDFLGDGTILLIKPNGVGAHSDWVSNGGANWDAVNEAAPDGDATWVNAQSTTAIDTYQYEDIPAAATVKGIQVCILARKETEGGASIAPVVRPTTTDYIGPTQGVGNILYDHYTTQAWDLNPQTMGKFTPAELNATQFGVKKVL